MGYQLTTMGPGIRHYWDRPPIPMSAGMGVYSGAGAGTGAYSGPEVNVGYRVKDKEGYIFEVRPDAVLRVHHAPAHDPGATGVTYKPGTQAYEQIVARLKTVDPDIEWALGRASTEANESQTRNTGAFASFIESLGLNTPEGQQQAATFLTGVAPVVQGAVQTIFGSKGQDLPRLQGRLARLRAQLLVTRDPVKRASMLAEAQGIQAQIELLRQTQADAAASLSGTGKPPVPQEIPFWVWPTLAVGVLGVGTIIFLSTRKK